MDHPGLLPWRTDAAQALLGAGRPDRAADLIADQLAPAQSAGTRVRGVALRLSAATAQPRRRIELLTEAVDALRDCGDRLELARALADLGSALQMNGAGTRAGVINRRAWQLAADCGATPLCERIRPTRPPQPTPHPTGPTGPVGASGAGGLSDPEERVATLAAHGYTNREIAAKLFVSTSTVEHHLTRVYRKLGISRRQDLPADLRTRALRGSPADCRTTARGALAPHMRMGARNTRCRPVRIGNGDRPPCIRILTRRLTRPSPWWVCRAVFRARAM
ncbi:helix-turn-helix transcriptional regulator (plasmid) [Streptomyces galilaeus]